MRQSTITHRAAVVLAAAGVLVLGGCADGVTDPTVTLTAKEQLRRALPSYEDVRAALRDIVDEQNGGLGFEMWAAIVDRDGFVLEVLFSGETRASEWPGSRVIAAQKANTANAFSLSGFALSTANLYAPTQPGGSLYGLQESNPVDPEVAYGGNPQLYGTRNDPMTGKRIGGVNVFGGGLGLYSTEGTLLGAIGVSGDTSCSDHIIAWKLRHALNLDNVPAGAADGGSTDNIIYDTDDTLEGFEHPTCFDTPDRGDHVGIGQDLATTHPVGPQP
jgi:uncharacterized protein GlcG (DUF336 family)